MSEEQRNPFTPQRIIATVVVFVGCLMIDGVGFPTQLGLFVGWVVFEYNILKMFD